MSNAMRSIRAVFSTAVCLLGIGLATAVSAQNLEQFVVSGAAAEAIKTRTEISADTAERIVDACRALAEENDVTVSVFVLSPSGDIVHAHRMDGQMPIGVDTALMKAETALYMRTSTHEVSNRFNDPLGRITRVKLDWYLVSGGLPIVVDNQIIGAIGVGGARGGFDERCAHHALTEVLGPQPPLVQD
ncbi:MAG TPA: heme-binding protein [Gammaproteobacteria bacterium]